jgi:hypothetical protein
MIRKWEKLGEPVNPEKPAKLVKLVNQDTPNPKGVEQQ